MSPISQASSQGRAGSCKSSSKKLFRALERLVDLQLGARRRQVADNTGLVAQPLMITNFTAFEGFVARVTPLFSTHGNFQQMMKFINQFAGAGLIHP
jgi:hypothetical protein